ncbi:MAG: hypothetical protein Q8L37_02345 [Candidatus Gottesmanbacteria bacterium]|nr:hypothetical protein [Candidatus Gottesmanbacteria bacterium]
MAHPPKSLQAVLKSAAIEDLDLEKNKAYIVHQILAFGSWEQMVWLLNYYGANMVREVFQKQPMKLYSPQAFHFSQLILNTPDALTHKNHYDQTLSRDLG